MHNSYMKTAALPPIRVSPETRQEAEALLRDGESLSSFVTDAVVQHIEERKAQDDFLARGLASATKAKRTGEYVSAGSVLRKLELRLQRAKSRAR
jgi:predicted transcriptional regulator